MPPKTRTTRARRARRSKTARKVSPGASRRRVAHVVRALLDMTTAVRLYHWNTRSFAQHKATDELYAKLDANVDRFVEVLLGKGREPVELANARGRSVDAKGARAFSAKIHEYRAFLIDMDAYFGGPGDSDLLSIRDDILGDVNQFLYLMTFDK